MLKLPSTWRDITVAEFIELTQIIKNNPSEIECYYSLLGLFTGMEPSELDELDYDYFIEQGKRLSFLTQIPPNYYPKQKVTTPAGDLYFYSTFEKDIKLNEFIDLEYLVNTENFIDNLKLILAIFYRKHVCDATLLHPLVFEPYDTYIQHRSELFNDVKIMDVFGVISIYSEFRETFFKNYEGYFGSSEPDEVDDDIKNESIVERSQRLKEIEKSNKYKKWGWHILIYELANKDILQMEKAYELPLLMAMNILSMKKELNLQ